MSGNDLVDLRCAALESNWQRKGFLDKLFSEAEKAHILSSADPFIQVWTYWTMKEAVYKIYSRATGIRTFAPAKLLCRELDRYSGTVSIDSELFHTRTSITPNYIHTIATRAISSLTDIRIEIIEHNGDVPEYASKKPACLSHHGAYLALIY